MVTPIVMPKFGQMTEDSAIVEWLKKEGDTVAKGDMLFLVETDKSVMEVESFSDGTLLKIVGRRRASASRCRASSAISARRARPFRRRRRRARPAPPSAPPRREDRRRRAARRRPRRGRAVAPVAAAPPRRRRRAGALPHQPARGGARQGNA